MEITTILLFLNILNSMGYSIIAPLFPIIGRKIGFNDALIGWVISAYSVSNTIITPFIPSLCQKFTRLKILYFSTFSVATCTVFYSFLNYITSFHIFLLSAIFIRIIHGLSSGIVFTLVYSLTISLSSKEKVQKYIGYLELGLCFGTSCGPLIASVFYKIGGYPLPFLVLGGFLYISVYLTSKIGKEKINSNVDKNEENLPFFKFFYFKEILIILGCFFIAMITGTFYLPCLTNYLIQKFNFSVSVASLFFIIPTIFYITILQLLDIFSNQFGLYGTASLGLLMAALGSFLFAPIIQFLNNIYFLVIGFGLLGAGQAPIFIPLLLALSKCIIKLEKNIDELTANDIATSLNNIFVAIGEFSGPIIGGYITSFLGFNYCCFFISIFIFIYFLLFSFYFYNEIINKLRNKEELLDNGNNEGNNIKKFHISFINYSKFLNFGNINEENKKRKYTFNNLERNENFDRISLYSTLTK